MPDPAARRSTPIAYVRLPASTGPREMPRFRPWHRQCGAHAPSADSTQEETVMKKRAKTNPTTKRGEQSLKDLAVSNANAEDVVGGGTSRATTPQKPTES